MYKPSISSSSSTTPSTTPSPTPSPQRAIELYLEDQSAIKSRIAADEKRRALLISNGTLDPNTPAPAPPAVGEGISNMIVKKAADEYKEVASKSTVQHSIVAHHSTAQCSTVHHRIVAHHCIAHHSIAHHSAAQYCTAQYSTSHHRIARALLHCTIQSRRLHHNLHQSDFIVPRLSVSILSIIFSLPLTQ